MQIIKAGSSIGTDIAGVDLAHLDSAEFRGIYGAWLESSVLRFRDQELTKDQLRAFSERFGPLEYAPMGKITPEQRASIPNPYVTNVSNIVENGRPIGGLGSAEANWHTDMSYIEHPPTASILMAVEVPEVGGDTEYCDMHAAFESLPTGLSDRARTLSIKHDAAHDSVGNLRRGFDHAVSPVDGGTKKRVAMRSSWADDKTRTYRKWTWIKAKRCWTRFGTMLRSRGIPGFSNGRKAMW